MNEAFAATFAFAEGETEFATEAFIGLECGVFRWFSECARHGG